MDINPEIGNRKTFTIIHQPYAEKTTSIRKLLLFGCATNTEQTGNGLTQLARLIWPGATGSNEGFPRGQIPFHIRKWIKSK